MKSRNPSQHVTICFLFNNISERIFPRCLIHQSFWPLLKPAFVFYCGPGGPQSCLLLPPSLTPTVQSLHIHGDGKEGTYIEISEDGLNLLSSQKEFLKQYYSKILKVFGKDKLFQLLSLLHELQMVMHENRGDE